MRIEKHQQNNGRGRGKLTFNPTPEQMAAFEASLRQPSVPGTNVNSNRTVGETARRAGIEATRTRQRANYKRDKRRSVGEMHTYVASKERQDPVTGEPIITETTDVGSNGSGAMSGRDPLLGTIFDLYTGTKAWNSGAKLLQWGAGKYMPSTILGQWGRRAIIDDVANRSFNPGGWGQLAARPVANVGSKNLFRTKVYKGGEITDPYSNFVTTDPQYAANYGKVTPYIFESKSIARAKEPMMGYRDPVSQDMFIYSSTKRNPNATAIIGHDAVTGEFTPSKGIEILNLNPENLYPIKTSEPLTSLKFFERKPSRISQAEKEGKVKGERNQARHGLAQTPYYDYSLINKHYKPWTVDERGNFVFESPEKSRTLGTIHFSFNEPVVSHIMGSWDDAPTLTILPYRNMRSQTAPVDMAIMDTYFPNYNGLKISSRGSKTLTGDRATFEYYKGKGLDVEFHPEMETKLQELKVLNNKYEALKSNPNFDYFSEETQELLKQIGAVKKSIDGLGREWTKDKIKPIPSYEKVNALGTAEGFDMEKYPYSLASPKRNGYGVPLEESATELNYNWITDPSNHFMIGEYPEIVLESALRGDYGKVRPEFIKYLRWASQHGADFRNKNIIK